MSDWNVLFVGLGPLGRMIINDYLVRKLGRIAGVVDRDPALTGRALRNIEGIAAAPEHGVIEPTVEAVLDREDPGSLTAAVVATSSSLRACMPTLRALLSRGVNVVSTCEELLWPWLRWPAEAAELQQLCERHGSRCLGTGVNPGFLMDTLPVVMSGVCRSVTGLRVERIQDATTRRIPFQQKIGAALSEEAFAARVKDGSLRHVGLGESLHFLSENLSLGVTRWDETIQPVRSSRTIRCAVGEIAAGGISGVRQTAHGWNARGEEVITLTFQAAIGQEEPRDRTLIECAPPDGTIEMIIPGAVHGDMATSAISLNAVGSLLRAAPGLHTMATVPVTRFVRG